MQGETSTSVPRMLTIRQVAQTGVLPEHALRVLVKSGQIPHLKVGSKVLVNYDNFIKMLDSLGKEVD